MIYLACPYSHPDPAVRRERFVAACRAAAALIEDGKVVFSPLSMSHPIEKHTTATRPTSWWIAYDEHFMRVCDELVVLTLPGWLRSEGVAREIAWFTRERLPISFMEPVE